MNAIIRYISVWSAFKVGCAFHIVVYLLLVFPFAMLRAVFIDDFSRTIFGSDFGFADSYVVLVILCLPFSSFLFALGWGFLALLLNLSLALVGGFQIRLEKLQSVTNKEPLSEQYRSTFGDVDTNPPSDSTAAREAWHQTKARNRDRFQQWESPSQRNKRTD